MWLSHCHLLHLLPGCCIKDNQLLTTQAPVSVAVPSGTRTQQAGDRREGGCMFGVWRDESHHLTLCRQEVFQTSRSIRWAGECHQVAVREPNHCLNLLPTTGPLRRPTGDTQGLLLHVNKLVVRKSMRKRAEVEHMERTHFCANPHLTIPHDMSACDAACYKTHGVHCCNPFLHHGDGNSLNLPSLRR